MNPRRGGWPWPLPPAFHNLPSEAFSKLSWLCADEDFVRSSIVCQAVHIKADGIGALRSYREYNERRQEQRMEADWLSWTNFRTLS